MSFDRLIQKIKCKFGCHVPKIQTIPMSDKYASCTVSCTCCYKLLVSDLDYRKFRENKLQKIEERLELAREASWSAARLANSVSYSTEYSAASSALSAYWAANSAASSASPAYWAANSALSAARLANSTASSEEKKKQVKIIKEVLNEKR